MFVKKSVFICSLPSVAPLRPAEESGGPCFYAGNFQFLISGILRRIFLYFSISRNVMRQENFRCLSGIGICEAVLSIFPAQIKVLTDTAEQERYSFIPAVLFRTRFAQTADGPQFRTAPPVLVSVTDFVCHAGNIDRTASQMLYAVSFENSPCKGYDIPGNRSSTKILIEFRVKKLKDCQPENPSLLSSAGRSGVRKEAARKKGRP